MKINLGCGFRHKEGFINVDYDEKVNPDVVEDALSYLSKLSCVSVDSIYSSHFFEHVDQTDLLLREVARVLKDGGTFEVIVPHFSNPYFHSDPTHKTSFGLYSFGYYMKHNFLRSLPDYCMIDSLKLEEIQFVFKSPRPFFVKYVFGKVLQFIVNSCRYTKELYESGFCWIFPCYEIVAVVKKVEG